jgi:hypothetical protein
MGAGIGALAIMNAADSVKAGGKDVATIYAYGYVLAEDLP